MKKPGLSMNPAALAGFFISHGEKLILALVGVLALLMIWWGIDAVRSQAAGEARSPRAVANLATQAAANIETTTKVPADRLADRRPLAALLDPWRPQQVKIAAAPAGRSPLARPLTSELTKRTKPDVFPMEDLRAVAGIAVLPDAAREPGAGAPPSPRPDVGAAEPARGRDRRGRAGDRDREAEGSLFGIQGGGSLEAPQAPAVKPLPDGRITPFVVVTGLIPAARQKAEYERRFGATSYRDPQRDSPRWAVYLVERARVVPGGSPRWERMEITDVERADPGGGRIGIAPPSGDADREPERLPQGFFLQPDEAEIGYAAALPKRIDESWGTTGMHPWFIPRLAELLEKPGEAAAPDAATIELGRLLEDPEALANKLVRLEGVVLDAEPQRQQDVELYKFAVRSPDGARATGSGMIGVTRDPVFAISERWGKQLTVDGTTDKARTCNLRVRVDLMGKTPVARILTLELLDADGGVDDTRTEPSPEPVQGVPGFEPAGGGFAAGPAGAGLSSPPADNRLFRFVDTKVKPGETYRYRVKFALRNPNVGLAPRHLVDPAAAKGEFLVSEYSPETPPVRVPEPTVVLARTIDRDTARKMRLRGDALEVMVLAPSAKTGNFSLRSTITEVGGLANVDMGLNRAGDTRFFGEPIETDRILLDARGSQEDRKDIRASEPPEPLEMLVLEPDGSFEIVSAADSERQIRRYGQTLFRPKTLLPDDGRPDRGERDADPSRGGQR